MAKAAKPAASMDDVTRADKSPANDSAKPIIVTNRPLIKDPMVNAQAADQVITKQSDTEKIPVKSKGVRIEPLGAPALPGDKKEAEPEAGLTIDKAIKKAAVEKEPPVAPGPEKPDAKPAPEPEPEAKPEPKPEPKPEVKPDPEPETATEETADSKEAPTDQKGIDKQAVDKAAAEKAEHDSQVEKLVDSKQFYLPINSVEKKRSRRVVVLGICVALLLAAAWVDVALDAGLIHLHGIQPLTHFFST